MTPTQTAKHHVEHYIHNNPYRRTSKSWTEYNVEYNMHLRTFLHDKDYNEYYDKFFEKEALEIFRDKEIKDGQLMLF